MIKINNLTKNYDKEVFALRDVNLYVKPGEFISVVGQSGSGKSTLVKLVIAEEKADSGEIVIGGWNITKIKNQEVPTLRRQLGVIFQDFKLLPKKTVLENVAFAMEACGFSSDEIKKTVGQILSLVGLKGKESRYPHQLSGGEQQRVAIARSMVHKPKLLVADEPTGNLDSINTREIVDLLRKINRLGTTVVLVTHNRDVVNNLRERVVTLDNGYIISDQTQGRYLL
ncbi:MAG: cell division ATP-binding protein FtsE [Candidatus Komeilibacteria bacterium CG11_big_fil_rev_8_21_14_0_20_36_20]|uniref:Cell division ATP-binding protein FtsE n=1 Tax=Candidatus Komeilibacteria bacterium CG11_big_fil_rev_8_21_14_0_20_36_20 TaxID=1974477 RepID=A0A2H0NEQ2_9BACT|nr:MAG: cell division ATP-binding protein FtsE [Candidatus Komeilibacteria bacterium CG11_big_fil_rev_8_21_14_0_20_36_20]PIR81183.1 MAG: cell division ATP-binding protein FtsE [Candidatus Komeilibacteria bacterium CG10_big_fil_rev_8_21_14_0_10_36_65]PJC55758.1 MAG: cell division ATP-binding protein FtsE [Candidatus Komeilibacteria bacterium CG_4_9_14_0_2_um_filter_36_13]